jgi:hypothetical protein
VTAKEMRIGLALRYNFTLAVKYSVLIKRLYYHSNIQDSGLQIVLFTETGTACACFLSGKWKTERLSIVIYNNREYWPPHLQMESLTTQTIYMCFDSVPSGNCTGFNEFISL